MRRSSCVVGLCTPGVSTSTTCAAGLPASALVFLRSGSSSTPRMRVRVVCGLCVTIASFCPNSAFSSVLLPAFGLPTIDTNPVRSAIPLFSHLQSLLVLLRLARTHRDPHPLYFSVGRLQHFHPQRPILHHLARQRYMPGDLADQPAHRSCVVSRQQLRQSLLRRLRLFPKLHAVL